MGFAETVLRLSQMGFYNFFAPFAIVFTVTLGILMKSKPFGDWEKSTAIMLIYGVISFMIALFVMLYGLNVYIEMFLAWVLGRAGLILIIILSAIIIAAFLGGEKGGE